MKKLRPPIEFKRLQELAKSEDPVVRELLWEIKRLHRVLASDLSDINIIRDAWAKTVGGNLAAIHGMRVRLMEEPGAFEWERDK